MGTKTVETLQKCMLVPKNRTISSLRPPNMIHLQDGHDILVTYSPAIMDKDYESYVRMILDCSLAIRKLQTGTFAPKIGKYKYVKDFSEAVAELKPNGHQKPLALDLETKGLDQWNPGGWIVSIQITYKEGESHVVRFKSQMEEQAWLYHPVNREHLNVLLNAHHIMLRGANLKYDLLWLWVRGKLECANFKFDTMLVGSLLDENRGNSLNLHTKWYCYELGGYDDFFNKKYSKKNKLANKGMMDKVPDEDFLLYAGGDTDACFRVADKMKAELLQYPRLTSFYVNLLHPAARAYEMVERCGMCLDIPYYLQLESEIKVEIDRLGKELLKFYGGRLRVKHSDNLSPDKPSLITDYLFTSYGLNLKPLMRTEKTEEASTSMDHLIQFSGHEMAGPYIKLLKEYKATAKTLNTYVARRNEDGEIIGGFLYHVRSDLRFHPTYFLFNGDSGEEETDGGTNTGRTSVRDPAIQTIPKYKLWGKRLRRAFIAPPGMLILGNDYSQGELKIAACLAREETMIAAYLQGLDLHAITAGTLVEGYTLQSFLDLEKSDKDLFDSIRSLGKAGNFGLIYGMLAPGFQVYAESNYGVEMTLEEAEERRNLFFKKYPRLLEWHEESKAFARMHKVVVSPLGRVRHLPLISSPNIEFRSKAERQSINSPVQGTLSDMSLWATAIFHQNGWFEESPTCGMIHDQLLNYVPEDHWGKHAVRNKEVMENLPFEKLGWKPQLKFTVESEIGKNLGEMKKAGMKEIEACL